MNKIDRPLKATGPAKLSDAEQQIDWSKIDTGLEYEGQKIVLPADPANMPLDTAIDTLKRVKISEEQTYDTHEQVFGLPWDALVGIFKAMQEIYGVLLPETMRGWFFDQNPSFISVKTGLAKSDVIMVPVGQIGLPGMKSPVNVGIHEDFAYIAGTVHKADRQRLVQIAERAREIMKESSIYKGKAISLQVNDKGHIILDKQPTFFDVRYVKEADMIHNDVTRNLIESSIFAPIKFSDACRRHKIPLKRGILLEGRYGCGKTLTARVTASVAMQNGWSFVMIDKPQGLSAALKTAVMYEPCVVFAEDIDRFGDRSSDAVNELVNLIDGLVPASKAIMTVLTTNYIEKIDKALLRPGRFDAVISIDPPDAGTVARLVRHYGDKALSPDVDVAEVGNILAGQIPATIAEVVKRAKLSMLIHGRDDLTANDLETAAHGMARHLRLLDDKDPEPSPGDRLFTLLKDNVAEGVNAKVGNVDFKRLETDIAKVRKALAL